MKLAFIGDVVGKPGRRAVRELVPELLNQFGQLDAIVINGENSAGFRGITHRIFQELIRAGADVVTTGNHVWAQQDIFGFIDDYIKVFKKDKKGLAGKFKILGQVGLGLIVGLIMVFHSDITIKEKNVKTEVEGVYDFSNTSVKSSKTTIPF